GFSILILSLLKYPMKRVGKRGEGKFERITWDEALDIIAKKLKSQKKKYGPESLAVLSPAFRSYNPYFGRFLTVHGSPNYAHSGICAAQMLFAFLYTLGTFPPVADYENSDFIVIWGKNPVYSGASKGGSITLADAKSRGARIASIKPSREPDAALADTWVPIRPGTDAALALAMLNVIINENLYDSEFVSKYCYGFDELKVHIQKYPPEWAEPVTGLDPSLIRDLARQYATAKTAAIDVGNGLEHAPSACDALRAIAIMIAITGNLDRKGGNLVKGMGATKMPMPKPVARPDLITPEFVDKLVAPEFPKPLQPLAPMRGVTSAYYRVLESVLTEKPYPIRTIIAPGTQPTVSTRGAKKVVEALKKVDFFVVIDVMRTAEMDYADVVVPVATPYETDHPFEISMTQDWIMARNKVIEPLGDYKSMYEFWLDLGVKMGYGDDFWNGNMKDCMNYQLESFNMSIDELRSHETGIPYPLNPPVYEKYDMFLNSPAFRVSKGPHLPQGKVAIYNTTFEELGYNPLPEWRELPEGPTATPELLKKYPLLLSDYHTSKTYNASWLRNVPLLREVLPHPTLHIHPETAETRGIKDGEWVIVESPHGFIKLKAEYFPGIRPDTVMALHGWWQGCDELGLPGYPVLDGGANTNNMYSVDPEKVYDPLISAMSSQTLVQVRKA
ncbi:molybdopterin-dependent oxidoreductase, partial [Thermodesulfobacteriota bacterium]